MLVELTRSAWSFSYQDFRREQIFNWAWIEGDPKGERDEISAKQDSRQDRALTGLLSSPEALTADLRGIETWATRPFEENMQPMCCMLHPPTHTL
jgi:hypothetical protein